MIRKQHKLLWFYQRGKVSLLACVAAIALGNIRAAQITDLGTLGGNASYATGVNGKGQVTGMSRNSDSQWHIFLWDGSMLDISKKNDLGPPNGYHESVSDVNDNGLMAGHLPDGTAALLTVGQTTSLGIGAFSTALAVNNNGLAVGYFNMPEGFSHGFRWQSGTATALTPFTYSIANGVNDFSVIVGQATNNISVPYHAVIWQNGTTTDIMSGESYAMDVNSSGSVVGHYWTGTVLRAFWYNNGDTKPIGSGSETLGLAINDSEVVVGAMIVQTANGCRACTEQHAYRWDGETLTDLNTTVSGWTLWYAIAINNNGAIVGQGRVNGEDHAFLWQP